MLAYIYIYIYIYIEREIWRAGSPHSVSKRKRMKDGHTHSSYSCVKGSWDGYFVPSKEREREREMATCIPKNASERERHTYIYIYI